VPLGLLSGFEFCGVFACGPLVYWRFAFGLRWHPRYGVLLRKLFGFLFALASA
jgi:hypothetical protein